MRILFLGDIMGRPGRKGVAAKVKQVRAELGLDLVVANGENASRGLGLTSKNAKFLLDSGIDLLTSGNHIWKFQDIYPFLNSSSRILRPGNYAPDGPGRGMLEYEVQEGISIVVMNLQGRVFMDPCECPFKMADCFLDEVPEQVKIILVDFHAEATSEKQCMGRYLDGRVSAVLGTHTHVQTNDAQIFEGGTGYITDAGFCGPVESSLGMSINPVLKRMVTGLPQKWRVAGGPIELQGVLLEINEQTGKTIAIETWNSGRMEV